MLTSLFNSKKANKSTRQSSAENLKSQVNTTFYLAPDQERDDIATRASLTSETIAIVLKYAENSSSDDGLLLNLGNTALQPGSAYHVHDDLNGYYLPEQSNDVVNTWKAPSRHKR